MNGSAPEPRLLDRSDTRVKHAGSLTDVISAFIDRVKAGDLGSLPVIVGLIVIWTVFTILNPLFVTPNNLVNLLFDCSTVGVIALGIVCVLMLGEIDLSVGSMSGVGSALIGVLWVNQGVPLHWRSWRRSAPARSSARCMHCCALSLACPASSRPSPVCWRFSACSSTCSAPPAPSTCPTAPGW